MTPVVSRWLRRLVEWLAPADERTELLADLDDERDRRATTFGQSAGARWHRRQLVRSIGPLLVRRLTLVRRRSITAGTIPEVRLALRSLRASPVFTGSVIAMLAVAIGSHTVVYAVLDALLLRPLPFGERSPRLITLHSMHPTLADDWDNAGMSYLDLLDVRAESTALDAIEGVFSRNISVSTRTQTERVLAASVTPGLFSLLGVQPALGRAFTDADAAPAGFEQVAVIGHGLWQSLVNGDPGVVGRAIGINGRNVTVVGVMPAGFSFPDGNMLWLPYRGEPTIRRNQRGLLAVGLLHAGVTLDSGTTELRSLASRLAERHPDSNRDWTIHVMPFRAFFVSTDGSGQLLGAVSLLLLAACANVAGLIVARGLGRQPELRLRAALGAGRGRLVRLLMIENTVLAVAGGAAGLLAASWGIHALIAWIPEPPPYWATPALDSRVALFAVLLTSSVTLLAGLAPAIRVARVDAAGAVLPGARQTRATAAHARIQNGLVAGQVAVSFALLVGAALLGRSATALIDADGGFNRESLLSLRFYIAGDRYDAVPARAAIVNEIVARLGSLPGVQGAAATGAIPTDDGGAQIRLRIPAAAGAFDEIGVQLIPVTPSFWQTLGVPLAGGRTFTATEALDGETASIIVNRRLAARLWPDGHALEHTIDVPDERGIPTPRRIVGIAPDLAYEEFGEETPQSQLNVYVPYVRAAWRTQAVLVRTAATAAAFTDAARAEVRAIDPGFAIYDVLTMDDRRQYNHWSDRFIGRTFWAFAAAALLLTCVGAYAISAYSVAQRRREIGVRLAVGADRGDILRLFLARGMAVALTGAVVGAPFALLVARALEHDLFRVSPWQPGLWVALPLTLCAAVAAASYLPARRASRIDPSVTLRDPA